MSPSMRNPDGRLIQLYQSSCILPNGITPIGAMLDERAYEHQPLPVWTENNDPVKKRAMKLLAKKIGFRKFRSFRKKGYFEEKGKSGIFRFHNNDAGGVSIISKVAGRDVEIKLCIQTMASNLPKGDVILSRWLEWKNDEEKFLKICNFTSAHVENESHRRESNVE